MHIRHMKTMNDSRIKILKVKKIIIIIILMKKLMTLVIILL